MAEMLGKETALLLPAGTMANQVDLCTLSRPGDERSVRVSTSWPRAVRAVTHLDVDRTQCVHAACVLVALLTA